MAQLDFGLLNTNAPAQIAGAYGRGQQEAQANQLAQLQMRQQTASTQGAEMNLARVQKEHAALDKLMTDITANGGPSDPMQAADMMMKSGHPDWFAKGLLMKQSYAQLNSDRVAMGLPSLSAVAAPAPATAAPAAAPAPAMQYPQTAAPVTGLGSGMFGMSAPTNAMAPAAPVNTLAAQTQAPVGPDKNALMMQAKAKMLSPTAGVREAGKLEMQHLLTANKAPSAVEEYRFAQTPEGGSYRGSFEAFKILHAPRTTTNVNVPVSVSTEKKYGEAFGTKIADVDIGKMTTAEKAPQMAENANRIIDLVKQGNVFTGPAADVKLNIARVLNVAGASNDEKIANTESLIAGTGQSTLDAIKGAGLGTGQGFTDKDLKFLQGIAGGTIGLTPRTLTDLAELQHRVAVRSAEAWNKRSGEMPKEVIQGTGLNTTPIKVPPLSSGAAKAAARPAGVGANWTFERDNAGNTAWVSPDRKSFKEAQ